MREERRKIRSASEYLESANRSLALIQRPDWLPFPQTASSSSSSGAKAEEQNAAADGGGEGRQRPPSGASASDRHPHSHSPVGTARINVSGLMFEAPQAVLQRDPKSILADLPGAAAKDRGDVRCEEGIYHLERDWWLFRYMLAFLRDGTLPGETALLVALYREANFYGLLQLQCAIEERKLHLREPPAEEGAGAGGDNGGKTGGDGSGNGKSGDGLRDKDKGKENENEGVVGKTKPPLMWWKSLPSWFTSVDEVVEQQKKVAKEAGEKREADWWVSTSYKGRNFVLKQDSEKDKK